MNTRNKIKLSQIKKHNRINIYTSEDIFILTLGYESVKLLQPDFLKPMTLVALMSKDNALVTTIDLDNFDFISTQKGLRLNIKNVDDIVGF